MKIQGRTMFFHVFVLSFLVSLFLKTTSIGFLILRYKVFYTTAIKKLNFILFLSSLLLITSNLRVRIVLVTPFKIIQ